MTYLIDSYLNEIERVLLPIGMHFSDQQKEVIENNQTVNIVAGPGSGKTTVLIAKCALLLRENVGTGNGICLITHTNVAVDEIREGLSRIGFEDIGYPNFIGTIQEFVNYFFARKTFHILLKNKNMRVLDEDEYKLKFEEKFIHLKPDWYTANPPNPKYKNPKMIIDKALKVSFISDTPSSYQDAFNWSIERVFNNGIINNEQCLEMAEWYIENHLAMIRKALKKRFKFVLLDEAQDTNTKQLQILNKIFLNNVIFQRFGDPYQSLYTIFTDEDDAWVPSDDTIAKLEISETARFNEEIAKQVRMVAIEKYDNFISKSPNNSLSPYFITYKSGDDLLIKYRELIQHTSDTNQEFKLSVRKDAIVSLKHDELRDVFSYYEVAKAIPKNSQSLIIQIYHFIIKYIAREKDVSKREVEEVISNNYLFKMNLAQGIKQILSKEEGYDIIFGQIEQETGNYLLQEKKTYILDTIEKLMINNFVSSKQVQDNEKDIYIGTVHSVKGETHRSTLLVLNSVFADFNQTYSYHIINILDKYITGEYIPLGDIEQPILKRETKKALKLAYVAFSRPTHILAIGIQESLMTKTLRQGLLENGWEEF